MENIKKMKSFYRSDIGFDLIDYKMANLIRVMEYEKIPYRYENNKLIDLNKNEEVEFNDNEYNSIDQFYSKLIPLWEDEKCNAKKYPDLYDDKKWIIGKREKKRVHPKLLIMDNGFKFKVGYLWKHQPFNQRPTYGEHHKFVKTFKAKDINNNIIIENENWGAILAQVQQYIKDNAKEYYDNYTNKVLIQGYCKSENIWFDIVEFNVLKTNWILKK